MAPRAAGRVPSITVYLERPDIERLNERAEKEKRSSSAQAALYILKGLEVDGS